MALAGAVGHLGSGWLSDIVGRKRTLILGFCLVSGGMFVFALVSSSLSAIVPFIVIYGLGYGVIPAQQGAVIRDYYGSEAFGTIFGTIGLLTMVGGVIGPPLAGWTFDSTGEYSPLWFVFATMALLGIILMVIVPSPDS